MKTFTEQEAFYIELELLFRLNLSRLGLNQKFHNGKKEIIYLYKN